MEKQASKVALITGANKGLGLEIARQLGQQGIVVVLGARQGKADAPAARRGPRGPRRGAGRDQRRRYRGPTPLF